MFLPRKDVVQGADDKLGVKFSNHKKRHNSYKNAYIGLIFGTRVLWNVVDQIHSIKPPSVPKICSIWLRNRRQVLAKMALSKPAITSVTSAFRNALVL